MRYFIVKSETANLEACKQQKAKLSWSQETQNGETSNKQTTTNPIYNHNSKLKLFLNDKEFDT